jgi:hypothetical protein
MAEAQCDEDDDPRGNRCCTIEDHSKAG